MRVDFTPHKLDCIRRSALFLKQNTDMFSVKVLIGVDPLDEDGNECDTEDVALSVGTMEIFASNVDGIDASLHIDVASKHDGDTTFVSYDLIFSNGVVTVEQ